MTEILYNRATIEGLDDTTLSEIVDKPRIAQVTIVVPTRNERDNVQPLLRSLELVTQGIDTTVIFVDDSDDDTPIRIADESLLFSSPTFRPQLIATNGGTVDTNV